MLCVRTENSSVLFCDTSSNAEISGSVSVDFPGALRPRCPVLVDTADALLVYFWFANANLVVRLALPRAAPLDALTTSYLKDNSAPFTLPMGAQDALAQLISVSEGAFLVARLNSGPVFFAKTRDVASPKFEELQDRRKSVIQRGLAYIRSRTPHGYVAIGGDSNVLVTLSYAFELCAWNLETGDCIAVKKDFADEETRNNAYKQADFFVKIDALETKTPTFIVSIFAGSMFTYYGFSLKIDAIPESFALIFTKTAFFENQLAVDTLCTVENLFILLRDASDNTPSLMLTRFGDPEFVPVILANIDRAQYVLQNAPQNANEEYINAIISSVPFPVIATALRSLASERKIDKVFEELADGALLNTECIMAIVRECASEEFDVDECWGMFIGFCENNIAELACPVGLAHCNFGAEIAIVHSEYLSFLRAADLCEELIAGHDNSLDDMEKEVMEKALSVFEILTADMANSIRSSFMGVNSVPQTVIEGFFGQFVNDYASDEYQNIVKHISGLKGYGDCIWSLVQKLSLDDPVKFDKLMMREPERYIQFRDSLISGSVLQVLRARQHVAMALLVLLVFVTRSSEKAMLLPTDLSAICIQAIPALTEMLRTIAVPLFLSACPGKSFLSIPIINDIPIRTAHVTTVFDGFCATVYRTLKFNIARWMPFTYQFIGNYLNFNPSVDEEPFVVLCDFLLKSQNYEYIQNLVESFDLLSNYDICHIYGLCSLETGNATVAVDCFCNACIACYDSENGKYLNSWITADLSYEPEEEELFRLYFNKVMDLFMKRLCGKEAIRFAHFAVNLVPADKATILRDVWKKIFLCALQFDDFDEAYFAAIANPDRSLSSKYVSMFVTRCLEVGKSDQVLARHFPGYIEAVASAILERARIQPQNVVPMDLSFYYVLYMFHAKRFNYQEAAAALVEYSMMIQHLPHPEFYDWRHKALNLAHTQLSFCNSSSRYLTIDTSCDKTRRAADASIEAKRMRFSAPVSTHSETVITDEELQTMIVVADAQNVAAKHVFEKNPESALPKAIDDTFKALLEVQAFDKAEELAASQNMSVSEVFTHRARDAIASTGSSAEEKTAILQGKLARKDDPDCYVSVSLEYLKSKEHAVPEWLAEKMIACAPNALMSMYREANKLSEAGDVLMKIVASGKDLFWPKPEIDSLVHALAQDPSTAGLANNIKQAIAQHYARI